MMMIDDDDFHKRDELAVWPLQIATVGPNDHCSGTAGEPCHSSH